MLIKWNYEESVKRVSAKVTEWKAISLKKSTLTDEIAKDLYDAREQLSKPGLRTDLVTNVTRSWNQYLEDVGLQRMTVHRWLEHFDPEEQRLLTDDEYENKKHIESRKKQNEQEAIKSRVKQAIQTGKKPEDWTDETEKEYQIKVKENEERDERRRKFKDEVEERTKKREELQNRKYGRRENISELLKEVEAKQTKKEEFIKQIGLTGDNASHDFNDILINYLGTLPSNGQKIEACHNIIKICKGVVSNLQQKSINE